MNERRLASAAFAFVLMAGASACSLAPGEPSSAEAEGGAAIPVRRASIQLTVPAEGELEAMQAAPIAVPRVPTGALLVREVVAEGLVVAEGDVLVVFDDTQLEIDLENHRASFRSASRRIDRSDFASEIAVGRLETVREIAEIERDNASAFRITDTEIFSKREILEDTVREREAGETVLYAKAAVRLRGEFYEIEERIVGVERAQAQDKIARVETSLGNLVLRAPIGGLVVYRKSWRGETVAVGDTLWPGNVIMSIVDPKSVGLSAFVHERDAAGVQQGARAQVVVDALADRVLEGKVARVAEVARPIEQGSPVKYTEVKIEIDDEDRSRLQPGMKGRGHIVVGTLDNALVVPRAAVHGDRDAPFVLLARGGSTEKRGVTLGPGDLVQVSVTEGLDEGDRIVIGISPEPVETAASGAGSARSVAARPGKNR